MAERNHTKFNEEVKRLRGKQPPKCTRKAKADCTPLEWARNLDYEKNRTRDRQERNKANKKLYRKKSKDPEFMRLQSERSSEYRRKNLQKVKEAQKLARSKPEYIEKRKKHRKENREKENSYRAKAYKNNHQYRMACCLRARFHKKVNVENRSLNTFDLIGTSPKECAKHLESLFTEGMNWNNYGSWHIDHVVPLCSFDLTDIEEQKKAFHYTNLQPLWGADNLRKGIRIV